MSPFEQFRTVWHLLSASNSAYLSTFLSTPPIKISICRKRRSFVLSLCNQRIVNEPSEENATQKEQLAPLVLLILSAFPNKRAADLIFHQRSVPITSVGVNTWCPHFLRNFLPLDYKKPKQFFFWYWSLAFIAKLSVIKNACRLQHPQFFIYFIICQYVAQ